MELIHPRLLNTFVVLAEELHFGKTATRLGIAQSTVSDQLGALEHELGVVLFTRHSRGVALTERGSQLVEPARRLVDDSRHFLRLARISPDSAQLVVGCTPAAVALSVAIQDRVAAQGLPVSFRVAAYDESLRRVARSEFAAALGILTPQMMTEVYDTVSVYSTELHLVMGRNHPLAAGTFVTTRDLIDKVVLVGPGYRLPAESNLRTARGVPIIKESSSIPMSVGEVVHNGVLALSAPIFRSWWDQLGAVDRRFEPPIPIEIGFAVRSDASAEVRSAVDTLASLARAVICDLGGSAPGPDTPDAPDAPDAPDTPTVEAPAPA